MFAVNRARLSARSRAICGALAAVLVVAALALTGPASGARAADLSQFEAGNIISDAVFFDTTTMDQAQIQSFLAAKEGTCAAGSNCLRTYTDVTRSIPADPMCKAYAGGYRETAAAIIYKVSQACGINPQVILVMLQKEQALVTSKDPSAWNIEHAMGANCPDSTGCDGNSSGFFIQVYSGVWQLKRYGNPPGTSDYFTWYAPGHTWNILYSTNTSCGTKAVYVQNQATADLYYYTPYTPNAAALQAGYGPGNACSSYGNRNFYNYFTDWFGSTQTVGGSPAGLPCAVPVTGIAAASDTVSVNVPNLNARTAPSTNCATGLVSIHQGQTFARTGTYDGWSRIIVNGATMWASSMYLTVVQPVDPPAPDPPAQSAPVFSSTDRAGYVMAADSGGTVWAYPISSTGAFGTRVPTAYTTAGLRAALPVGDLIGNGHNALVTVGPTGEVLRYRGSGGTGFAAPTTLGVTWAGMLSITAAGDATGDGIPDVYTLTAGHTLELWRGNAHGGFLAPTTVAGDWSGVDMITAGVDMTGDGIPDLIARTTTGSLMLYPGNGAGGFGSPRQIGVGWSGMTAIFEEAGVGGAGRGGVLARTASGQLRLYTNTGNGTLTGGTVVGAGWQGMTALSGAAPAVSGVRTNPTGIGDVNGDLTPDVLAVRASGGLALYPGNGRGGWQAVSTAVPGWGNARLVRLGDFSGTGFADIGAVTSSGAFVLYPGTGTGRFGAPQTIGSRWGAFTAVIGDVDYSGDGRPGVLARNAAGQLVFYQGDGHGGWASGGTGTVVGVGWGGFTSLTEITDFTGDGRQGILARRGDGTLWLYPLTGAGGWGRAVQVGQGWNGMTAITGTGDFDGDGHTDVLARLGDGSLKLYRGNGHGGWLGITQVGWDWNGMAQIG